jgi:hypothetical protein
VRSGRALRAALRGNCPPTPSESGQNMPGWPPPEDPTRTLTGRCADRLIQEPSAPAQARHPGGQECERTWARFRFAQCWATTGSHSAAPPRSAVAGGRAGRRPGRDRLPGDLHRSLTAKPTALRRRSSGGGWPPPPSERARWWPSRRPASGRRSVGLLARRRRRGPEGLKSGERRPGSRQDPVVIVRRLPGWELCRGPAAPFLACCGFR